MQRTKPRRSDDSVPGSAKLSVSGAVRFGSGDGWRKCYSAGEAVFRMAGRSKETRMFQVMIVAKISTGAHLAVTSQLAQCETREQADALCVGVEKQNKESRALPGFSAATIKLYET